MENAILILGTYIALMAVLAVLVEAVVSWLKIPGNSPLKGKPSPESVMKEVKVWLTDDEVKDADTRIATLNKALESVGEARQKIVSGSGDLTEITQKIGIATAKHFQNEQKRRGFIRALAIVLGVVFAFIFQIDTFEILKPMTDSALEVISGVIGAGGAHFLGIVLSGFAASAGSSFWHDQSAKLRGIKDAQESVSELMK